MSFRRCFFKCESSASLYGLPKNESVRNKWLLFIFQAVPEQYSPHTFLCSRHFTEDCFGNWAQFRSGFAKKLTLIEGSVPTLFNVRVVPASPRPRPSTSHISSSSRTNSVSRVRSLGCQTDYTLQLSRLTQTDPPKRRGVATQLSWGTLRNWHMRSKGTQTPHLSTSITDMDSRPSKRPHIEVKEEVEEVEIGEEGEDEEEEGEGVEVEEEEYEYEEGGTWTEPLDSPVSPGDPNADEFEIEIEPQSAYGDTKYIVSDSCLMELFEICPVCKGRCAVERRRVGLIVAFKQICQHCNYSRVWQNQPSTGGPPVGNIQHSADTYYTDTSVIKTEENYDQQAMFQELQKEEEVEVGVDDSHEMADSQRIKNTDILCIKLSEIHR